MNSYMHLCTHQKLYKLNEGIMLIFVSEKNRPLLWAKGVCKFMVINILSLSFIVIGNMF